MRAALYITSTLALAVGFLLAGCAKPPGQAVPDPVSEAEYPQISALGWLDEEVAYGKPNIRYSQNGNQPLEVNVPARLLLSNRREVQYRFIFFAADGRQLKPQMDWRYKEMPGRAQVFFDGTATSTEAKDWRLEIRPLRHGDG